MVAALAQELPVRVWGVREGLAESRVNAITRDAHGYVWIATWEGVSRFDGSRFVVYGAREGLPNPLVWCIAQAPDGRLWFGTHGGGLAWLDERAPSAGAALHVLEPAPSSDARRVFSIAFDRGGSMWLSTAAGLFVGGPAEPQDLRFEHVAALGDGWFGKPFEDQLGDLWFVGEELAVRCRGRGVESFAVGAPRDLGEVRGVAPRRAGGCWVAYLRGLCEVQLPARAGDTARLREFDLGLEVSNTLYAVCEDAAGRLWVGTARGLLRIDGASSRWLGVDQGLPDDWVHALADDERGGLWVGTHHGGVALLVDAGVESYTRRSGLGDGNVSEVLIGAGGRVVATTEVAGIFELDRGRARKLEGSDRPPFDRVQHELLVDRAGDWWLGTSVGLWHARGPELDLARATQLGSEHGLPQAQPIGVVGLDPNGRVLAGDDAGAVYLQANGDGVAHFARLPFVTAGGCANACAFDASGALWISNNLHLWRWNGTQLDELPAWRESNGDTPHPRALLIDSRGWLWVGARFGGVAFTREPGAVQPRFERLTTRDGLSSETVVALAECRGEVCFGTGRGVDRYAPLAGEWRHFGASDGLAGEWVGDLRVDANETLWVATAGGLSRLDLTLARAIRPPPRVRFTACVVAGDELALPAAGAFELAPIEIAARDSRLAFEFVAVDPVDGERWRYQTRLEGLDSEWSEPSRELSARYGRLEPREYRFSVRSVDVHGGAASEPSSVAIRVFPPLWQNAWFAAALVALALAAAYGWHRSRLRRALALERLRTQIATDLHDDLGAGLAQIAILSEVARRSDLLEARGVMSEVADTARALRSSMSDLVWAVDPRHDSLADLVRRMRQFATDTLAASGSELDFVAPADGTAASIALAPDRRRHLLYAFREAATNVARHASAQHVEVRIELTGARLRVVLRDDGRGFDPQAAYEGQGLVNLRRRARELGSELVLESAPGRGTSLVLDVPLA